MPEETAFRVLVFNLAAAASSISQSHLASATDHVVAARRLVEALQQRRREIAALTGVMRQTLDRP
jgi:hypothetical protein